METQQWDVRAWRRLLASPDWMSRYEAVLTALPWVLLLAAFLLEQVTSDHTVIEQLTTAGLVALAATWLLLAHTRVAPERRTSGRMSAYFAGFLLLALALLLRDDAYLLFAVTGFFHATYLRPWPLLFAGVLGVSLVINATTMELEPTLRTLGPFVGVVLVQTLAIGGGIVFSAKGLEQHRRLEEVVARLESTLEENAGLQAQLVVQAREAGGLDERQRLAREIHDTLAQGLAGIITQAQAAQRVWHAPDRARPHVDRALALAREALTEARRSVQALRPTELESTRLPDALADLTRRWATDAGVTTTMDVTGEAVPLAPATEVALFRTAQESLTNVARHAGASRVAVTLSYLGDVVLLDIRDDGTGFEPDLAAADPGLGAGFGLLGMSQRVEGVGGVLTVESAPGEGTAVGASVPAATP